jgi:site-specific recombinase XerD
MAHRFLENSGNDIVSPAQILGRASLNTTMVYTRRSISQLSEAADKLTFEIGGSFYKVGKLI